LARELNKKIFYIREAYNAYRNSKDVL